MPRTRIIATLGPASASPAGIRGLLDAGVDVFRLNFSHGTREEHGQQITTIRELAGDRPVAILQDLGGPKLRLKRPVRGQPGDVVEIELPGTVHAGDPVLLADGAMQLEVVDAGHARVVVGGDIPAGKGINLPSSRLDTPSLTPKDLEDLRFGLARGVDLIAVSFVRRAADLDPARKSGLPVIAKIERAEALEHLDELVDAADGVMVARGDLGVETPIARVPLVQKEIIALANRAAKPVITATQMLRSMVESPLPTRAEASDVANAVLDGTDAVMLSEESAIGRYPDAAVRTMREILTEAERLVTPREGPATRELAAVMATAACTVAERTGVRAIVVPTRTGRTARLVALHRPRVPIIALAATEALRRQLSLVWGVTAVTADWPADAPTTWSSFSAALRVSGLVAEGTPVVVTAGWPFGSSETTNLVMVTTL